MNFNLKRLIVYSILANRKQSFVQKANMAGDTLPDPSSPKTPRLPVPACVDRSSGRAATREATNYIPSSIVTFFHQGSPARLDWGFTTS